MSSFASDFGQLLVISTLTAASIVAFLIFFMYLYLMDRSKSRYDEEEKKAILSSMRIAYEKDLYEINKRLLATEERWRDVNHLLISAQHLQPPKARININLTEFLKSAGISEKDTRVDPKLIMVLTPFSQIYEPTYAAIVEICQRAGFKCVRGDEEFHRGDIFSHILRQIVRSRVVIANITGRNPNVFYELGVSHALDKVVILISQTLENTPFDVQSKRILIYDDLDFLQKELLTVLLRTVSETATVDESQSINIT